VVFDGRAEFERLSRCCERTEEAVLTLLDKVSVVEDKMTELQEALRLVIARIGCVHEVAAATVRKTDDLYDKVGAMNTMLDEKLGGPQPEDSASATPYRGDCSSAGAPSAGSAGSAASASVGPDGASAGTDNSSRDGWRSWSRVERHQ